MNAHSLSNNDDLLSNENRNLYIIYDKEPCEDLLIPTINPILLKYNAFDKDPFRNNIRHLYNYNDPRDGPFDGIRRKNSKIYEENSVYEGDWKNGKRDGFGILTFGTNSKYIKILGYFKEDKIVGFGKMFNEKGETCKGLWKDFQINGIGIYQKKKGPIFKGYINKHLFNGFGFEKWPKGSSYFGEYLKGDKNGIGILNFQNKAKYEGELIGGIINGIGTFYFGDRKYQGQWKNNKMHGFGVILWSDGNYFEGQFLEDKKEGFGIYYSKKKIFLGNWIQNALEGNVIIVDNGKIKKQFWKDGRPIKRLSDDTPIYFEKYIKDIVHIKT